MPKPKKTDPEKVLTPAQKEGAQRLLERKQGRNWLKLDKGDGDRDYRPAESDAGLAMVQAMEATGMPDLDAASKLIAQTVNATADAHNLKNANAAISMLQGIGPQDGLEGMLACQMVAVHNMAAECARRAMITERTEAADRYIQQSTKLMNVFTRQIEALQKYRTKGQQKITVQHVNVGHGGQAIVGNVHQGVGEGEKK